MILPNVSNHELVSHHGLACNDGRSSRVLRGVVAAFAVCASLVAPAWAQVGGQTPVKIGVVGPFTGSTAEFGVPMLNGIQLAVDEINAVGGYLGRPLELVIKDDGGNPDQGRKVSQELLASKVVAVLGFCNTGVALKAMDLFQDAQVPLIVPCASGTPVTAKYPAPESYVFRVQARDALMAPFMVDDILKRGWDKVAVFADKTGYGDGGLKDVVAALAAKNVKPVHVARFDLGVKDLTAELEAARSAGAEVIYSFTLGPENVVIAQGRKALGWKVPQVGTWPLSSPSFLESAKDASEGVLMVQTFIADPSNERRAAFLSGYSRKFQGRVTVPMAAANAYDATYLLMYSFLGIRNGSLSGKAIKESLEGKMKTYYGVVATYDKPFSAQDKDAITQNMLYIGKVKNGQVTFAYPEDAKRNLFVQRKQ